MLSTKSIECIYPSKIFYVLLNLLNTINQGLTNEKISVEVNLFHLNK